MKVYRVTEEKGQRYLARIEGRRTALLSDQTFARAKSTIAEIRKRGDQALMKHIRAFDLEALGGGDIRLVGTATSRDETLPDDIVRAVDASIDAVTRFHRQQRLEGYTDEHAGTMLSLRLRPVPAVGVVVPGRQHIDLTSIIMAVVPARLAGVPRVAVALAPGAYLGSPAVRFVLRRLGVDDVYLMSGVHAVAALAFGTESVVPVDLIVASGDAQILAAKYLVAPRVAVDLRGGLPELVILADTGAEPAMVASDLLAQMEHDRDALGVVVTTSARVARHVDSLVRSRLRRLDKGHPARDALRRWGAVLIAGSDAEACRVANRIAPSRVELLVGEPLRLVDRIEAAAVVTLGPWSPPALADVVAGVNHILPTLGAAVVRGPLGVGDFMRGTAVVRLGAQHYPKLAQVAATLAELEELPLHAASLTAGSRGER